MIHIRGRLAQLLPDEPLTIIKELEKGLRDADDWYRDANKKIILDFVDHLIPHEIQGWVKSAHPWEAAAAYLGEFVVSLISRNEVSQEYAKKYREAVVAQPDTVQRRILSDSEWTLDRLSHSERLQYMKEVTLRGPVNNNEHWMEVACGRRKPRYKVLRTVYIYHKRQK